MGAGYKRLKTHASAREELEDDPRYDGLDSDFVAQLRRDAHDYPGWSAYGVLDHFVEKALDPRPAPGRTTLSREIQSRAATAPSRSSETPAARVLRRPAQGQTNAPAPDDTALRDALRLQGGSPLPLAIRTELEQRLGGDFSRVRIHTDASADAACFAALAEAFTIADHVFFAAGAYQPSSDAGFELLCHELTHVVQYYQGRIDRGDGVLVSDPSGPLEREATQVASEISRTRRPMQDDLAARSKTPRPTAKTAPRDVFLLSSGPANTIARKPTSAGAVTLRLFGATYRIPLKREAGTTSNVSVPLNWQIGFLRLTHAELELDNDFEVKGGSVTGSINLGKGLSLDKATLRFDGTGTLSPKVAAGQLRLGRHATLSVKNLTLHGDGAVSGEFRGELSRGRSIAGGAIALKPGAWLGGTLHHNKLSGLKGGGARLRVDKLDADLTVPNFGFGKGGGSGWNWSVDFWKYLSFPKIKMPNLKLGGGGGKSKVRFTFEDADATFVDNVLTVSGKAKMWMGRRGIGVDVVAEVSRKGVDVRVGPQLKLPSIKIPLTPARNFWRPKNASGLFPLVPPRTFKGKGKGKGALQVSIGAGFGLEVKETSLEAFVKLTPPKLRGGVKLPGVELQAGKVPSPHRMFKAKLRVRASVNGGIGLPMGLGRIGMKADGDAFAQLGVNPTLRAHLSTAEGVISGGMSGRLRLSGDVKAKLGLGLVLRLFGMQHTQQIWKGAINMRRPLGWSPSFNFDFGQLGPDAIGDRPLVTDEHINSLAKDFDSNRTKRAPKTNAATTHLDRIQRMVEMVLTLVEILTPLHKAIGHFKQGEALAAARAAAMSPEKLFHSCMKFFSLVEKSTRDGTFLWMEKFLPGGRGVVKFLQGYMSAVETGAKAFGAVGTLIGREDPYATARKIRSEHAADNAAAIKATKAERDLLKRGADPMSARRVKLLTWKRHSPIHGSELPTNELFEILRKLDAKLPNARTVRNSKREALIARGIPRDIAHEIASLYRLAFVNATNESWRYVELAKKWEKSAMRLAMSMMAPTGDRRYFAGLTKGWLDTHQPLRRKIEKGIL